MSMNRVAIACAAPLSSSSRPSIAPNTSISATPPIVLPIPLRIDCSAPSRSIPLSSATTNDVRISAKNASSFTTSMSTSISATPTTTQRRGIFW